ncbi:MAG: hypothetical protein IJP89_10140 [Synergistaceae bacterium]|nr:hypothetical protein [Synergistaceae bacterium]MBR0151709.1 hypothetical protein [Synergistaceae bacterium]MBR0256817.1 hypothetical protein [Synergistaceae bacterium]
MNDDEKYVRKDIHEKDTDILAQAINNTNDRIDDVKDFITWGLTLLGIIFVIVQLGVGYLLYLLTQKP